MNGLEWHLNAAGKWAWFDGSRQVTGAYLDQGMGAYALEVHGLGPRREEAPPPISITSHPEFLRLAQTYGHLSLAEMDELAESMRAEARTALAQHTREFHAAWDRRLRGARPGACEAACSAKCGL